MSLLVHLLLDSLTLLGTTRHFQPKILLTIDDNVAVSADLSPKTKSVLEGLMSYREAPKYSVSEKIAELPDQEQGSRHRDSGEKAPSEEIVVDLPDAAPPNDSIFETDEEIEQRQRAKPTQPKHSTNAEEELSTSETDGHTKSHTIEITLRADSEFFHLLTAELSSIDNVQAREKLQLTTQVQELGNNVVAVTRPTEMKSASDLYAWREVFALYRDASVFFSTTERNHGAHTAEQARDRMQWFSNQIDNSQVVRTSFSPLTCRSASSGTSRAASS
jgi:hypothetical protein